MKNYDEMSDFEINKLVATQLHGEEWWHKYGVVFTMQLKPTDCGGMETRKAPVNYCKNPSDAWPIIVESKIDIAHTVSGDVSCAVFKADERGLYREFYPSVHKNPLRAAMICFLKIMDAK